MDASTPSSAPSSATLIHRSPPRPSKAGNKIIDCITIDDDDSPEKEEHTNSRKVGKSWNLLNVQHTLFNFLSSLCFVLSPLEEKVFPQLISPLFPSHTFTILVMMKYHLVYTMLALNSSSNQDPLITRAIIIYLILHLP